MEHYFTTKAWPNNIKFHVISTVSGRYRFIVSVIVGVLVVILNSAVLFQLIGPLISVLKSFKVAKIAVYNNVINGNLL